MYEEKYNYLQKDIYFCKSGSRRGEKSSSNHQPLSTILLITLDP